MFPWLVALFVVVIVAGGPLIVGIQSAAGVLGTLAFVGVLVVIERASVRGRPTL